MKIFCFKYRSLVSRNVLPAYLLVCMCVVACLVLSSCRTVPSSGQHVPDMSTAGLLGRVAAQMADDLDLKVGLYRKTILLSENNFWQRDSRINLPFSAVLRDAMAAALSDRGATVTLQDLGIEAWRLEGTYGVEGSDLVITIKAVGTKMLETGDISVNSVATRGKVAFNTLDRKWFKSDFSRVARTLMRMLDKNYSGGDDLSLSIHRLKPGRQGQPPLHLGQEFEKFLKTAAADSPLFIMSTGVGWGFKVKMQGTYTIVSDQMRFYIEVLDSNKRTLTSAVFDVDINEIPPDLLVPVAETDIDICVAYVPAGNDVSAESQASVFLVEYVMASLAEYNLKARLCTEVYSSGVRVETKINVRERSTPDGFRIASISVQIKPVGSDKRTIGTLVRKGRQIFSNNPDSVFEKAIQKMFEEKPIGEQLATMILGR